MNLVVGAAEETVQTIDVTEDGQAMPGRVGFLYLVMSRLLTVCRSKREIWKCCLFVETV